ncbi:MAG: hypothetical protein KJ955_00750 [Nanoarchaeota archaeon]|nr:hypothetical protein [Nanoarchaeota archaeon]
MHKRGQVTIFIILGIVIVIAVVFGIALRKDIAKGVSSLESRLTSSFQDEVDAVQLHVDDCLEKALKDAIYNSPIGRARDLTEERYEQQLAAFVKGKANECINFTQFEGLTIARSAPLEVEVDYRITFATADASMRISITKGEDSASLSEFSVKAQLDVPAYEAR